MASSILAKFPQEDYIRLQNAYETGDPTSVELSIKSLLQSVKKFAKDISLKYIDPPNTTDFGIMFLPIEGLFAEVVRQPDMIAMLQREYKIVGICRKTDSTAIISFGLLFQRICCICIRHMAYIPRPINNVCS